MKKRFINHLLVHTIVLLISIIIISIVNYKIDGGWTAIIVMICILFPQFVFVIGLVLYKLFSKAIIHNWFLLILIGLEGIGMALVCMESINQILPMAGYSILYIAIAISWVILTYYSGTWGKYKSKSVKNNKAK